MTTSSDHNSKSPSASQPQANHWTELSERLPVTVIEPLSDWLERQLVVLEKSQERFITDRSLMKSLRR